MDTTRATRELDTYRAREVLGLTVYDTGLPLSILRHSGERELLREGLGEAGVEGGGRLCLKGEVVEREVGGDSCIAIRPLAHSVQYRYGTHLQHEGLLTRRRRLCCHRQLLRARGPS